MVVSGMRTGKKYVLGEKPVQKEQDGNIYRVPKYANTMVKMYNRDCRKTMQLRVVNAINGEDVWLGPEPIEPVNHNGSFVGYVFETEQTAEEPQQLAAPSAPRRTGVSTAGLFVISAVMGAVFTALIYLLLFDAITHGFSDGYIRYNAKGIPMIVGGWIAMELGVLMLSSQVTSDVIKVICLAVAYAVGSAAVFLAICLVVFVVELIKGLVTSAIAIAVAILPAVAVLIAIVVVIKAIFR